MTSDAIPMLYVTANVGSIFEEPKRMLVAWVNEFLKVVKIFQPRFVALHCQEIGGKSYEGCMKSVDDFVRLLMTSKELMQFDRVRIFLDGDYTMNERFTALGNLYFIHETVATAHIWDFTTKTFMPCLGKDVHSGNIEEVSLKEKMKFTPEFFPECKWSRKGYLRTRWNIEGTEFDLVNIHLFHDASNFLAIETFPSVYSDYRHRALKHILERLKDGNDTSLVPYFIFGDFNFRLDTQGVVKRLTQKSIPQQVKCQKNGEVNKIIYTDQNSENKVILTLGKKEFDHHDHHEDFYRDCGTWLKDFDKEIQAFEDELFEFHISFPPSYPFCEDMGSATSYMKTRCPSWCDRILFNQIAKHLVIEDPTSDSESAQYDVIGGAVCMGDHKPVYLSFKMKTNAAIKSPLPISTTKSEPVNNTNGQWSRSPTSPDSTVTRYIHVRHPGSPVRIFRETTV